MQLFDVFAAGNADIQALRPGAQYAVQCDAHDHVAAAAHAAGSDAGNAQFGAGHQGIEFAVAVGQAFEDDRGLQAAIEVTEYEGFAGFRPPAPHQGRQCHIPFFAILPGSTPSCLSLRYRCVRSSPVFSATRVMLPPSWPR